MIVKIFSRLIFVSYLFIFSCSTYASNAIDGIAAVVNQHIITFGALNKRVHMVQEQMQAQKVAEANSKEIRKDVLQRMIDEYVLLDAATKQGITVSDQELAQQINGIAAQNHMTVEQFKKEIAHQGYSFDDYKKEIKRQLIVDALQKKLIAPKVELSDAEIQNAPQNLKSSIIKNAQYQLQAVLVQPLQKNTNQALIEKTINEIKSKLSQGTDPETIAIVESSDSLRVRASDMGWKSQNQLPPPLANKLEMVKPGSILPAFQTPEGIYILKLVAKRAQETTHQSEEYQARHIMLRLDDFTSLTLAKEKLNQLRQEALEKGNFSQLAEQHSQDTNTISKGGDLGWVKEDAVPPAFAQALKKLKAGEMSQPIQINDTVELIQLLAKRKVNDTNDFIHNRVKQMLYQQKFSSEMQKLIEKLRKDAYIKVNI